MSERIYKLQYRYGSRDVWTTGNFYSLASLEDEAAYKVVHGWEVRLHKDTYDEINREDD